MGIWIGLLDGREVWHIAKSVSRWTWQRFDISKSNQRFSELQSFRGKQGGLAQGRGYESKRASAQIMSAAGVTQSAIALELGVTDRTVRTWLKNKTGK
jgi:hypothetical protein